MTADMETLIRDAVRYRYLKTMFREHESGWDIVETIWGSPSLETLDACIDAYMNAQATPQELADPYKP